MRIMPHLCRHDDEISASRDVHATCTTIIIVLPDTSLWCSRFCAGGAPELPIATNERSGASTVLPHVRTESGVSKRASILFPFARVLSAAVTSCFTPLLHPCQMRRQVSCASRWTVCLVELWLCDRSDTCWLGRQILPGIR